MTIPPEELARLAGKYDELARLRRARDRGEPVPGAHVFKALAREFPGCLNELDTLPLEDIDARAASLRKASEGEPIVPWMVWLSGYHRLLRAALWLKPRLGRPARVSPWDDAAAAALAKQASEVAGVHVDAAFVREVTAPPGGRLVALVFSRLASEHGEPVATLKRALFPRSRRL